jgi:PKHD-type hydroxylase
MLSKYSYWLFKGNEGLNKKAINKIFKIFKKGRIEEGVIGKDNNIDKGYRDSDIIFSNKTELYDIVCPYIHTANEKANWNVDIMWNEAMQFTMYKKNQHYDWHVDNLIEPS